MMYFKSLRPPSLPEQTALDLNEPDDAPDLRFPELEPLRWHVDLQGYTLTVDYGIGGKSAIRLTDCRVNAFRFECCEGGTVKVTWRVQRSQPDERIVGKLSGLLKHEMHVTLMPSPEAQAVLAESDEAEGEPPWADATDTFIEQHGA